MKAWELEAREQIRELVARYNAAGDSGRIDEVVALFAPDARLSIEGDVYAGRDAIEAVFRDAMASARDASAEYIRHFVATHTIEVEDEARARGRCYFQVLTDRGLDHWGRYSDEYAAEAGRWRFAARRVRVDGAVPGGWGARHLERSRGDA